MAGRPSNWPKGRRYAKRKLPDLTKAEKAAVLKRFPTCWLRYGDICTGKSEQVHHLTEAADGGTNDPENLVGVCEKCHNRISGQFAQRRAVAAANDWKRKPEKRPRVR